MALYFGGSKIGKLKTGVAGKAEDLTNVLDAQESKLNALLTSLDGKAAGGSGSASVETCTVEISYNYSGYFAESYVFTTYENGEFATKHYMASGGQLTNATIENVVCGSGMAISSVFNEGIAFANLTGVESLDDYGFANLFGRITALPGETATITFVNRD